MATIREKDDVIRPLAMRPAVSKADGASLPMKAPPSVAAASVDTSKSQIHPTTTTTKQLEEEEKKEEEANKEKKEKKEEEAKKEKENGVQKLKSSLLVTGVMVAVIGAIFAVVKNIKKA